MKDGTYNGMGFTCRSLHGALTIIRRAIRSRGSVPMDNKPFWDLLIVAYERQCTVFIQIWQDRHFHFHQCTIRELDYTQQIVTCKDSVGDRQLALDSITSIHTLD